MRIILMAIGLLLLSLPPSNAEEGCSALAPTTSEEIDETFKGKIEGKIDGLIGRLAGAEANIEGEYKRLKKDALNQYEDHHRLYVWQRTLYLICIKPELGIDLNTLLKMYFGGPPDEHNQGSFRLKKLYRLALESIVTTLIHNEESMVPTLQEFLTDPQQANWHRVVWTAQENLDQVKKATNASLAYDSATSKQIVRMSRALGAVTQVVNRQYKNNFKSVRREWNSRKVILKEIIETRNVPELQQVEKWYSGLNRYYGRIKNELVYLSLYSPDTLSEKGALENVQIELQSIQVQDYTEAFRTIALKQAQGNGLAFEALVNMDIERQADVVGIGYQFNQPEQIIGIVSAYLGYGVDDLQLYGALLAALDFGAADHERYVDLRREIVTQLGLRLPVPVLCPNACQEDWRLVRLNLDTKDGTQTDSFCIQTKEVTLADYLEFDPHHWQQGPDREPVRGVSWYRAYAYAAWLGGTIPSGQEWEIACRGDNGPESSVGESASDENLPQIAWYDLVSGGEPQEVGLKDPNSWGLYDIHGNVGEWTRDWVSPFTRNATQRHSIAQRYVGRKRQYRGGAYLSPATRLQCSDIDGESPGVERAFLGLRVIRKPTAAGLCSR